MCVPDVKLQKKNTQFAFSNPSWGSDCDVVFVSSCKISRQLFKQPQRLGTPSGCHSWYMMMFLFVSQMSQILIEQANYLKIVNKQGTKPNNYLVALIPHRAFERDTSWWKMAQLPSEYGAWRRRRCSCVWRREGIHRRTKSWRMLGHIIYRHVVWTCLDILELIYTLNIVVIWILQYRSCTGCTQGFFLWHSLCNLPTQNQYNWTMCTPHVPACTRLLRLQQRCTRFPSRSLGGKLIFFSGVKIIFKFRWESNKKHIC